MQIYEEKPAHFQSHVEVAACYVSKENRPVRDSFIPNGVFLLDSRDVLTYP